MIVQNFMMVYENDFATHCSLLDGITAIVVPQRDCFVSVSKDRSMKVYNFLDKEQLFYIKDLHTGKHGGPDFATNEDL